MKFTVITGSPRKYSTSNYLADQFIKGAKENGHRVYKFDAFSANVNNCIACNACNMGSGVCIHKDDFEKLKKHILESDVIVFATPVYYFGMSSSIKKVIDRFYSIDSQLKALYNKSVFITSQHSKAEGITNIINSHYSAIANWLGFKNAGIINAIGIESIDQIKQTPYPKQAYELGKSFQ